MQKITSILLIIMILLNTGCCAILGDFGYTNSIKFHFSYCESAGLMSKKNKVYYFGTREELIAKGYSPCGNCDP